MNIREGEEDSAADAAVPPTPPVHADSDDDRFLRQGGEGACVQGWQEGGHVALANFNQVC
jgi:hypothetical protein